MTEWNLIGQFTLGACVPSCVAAVGALDAAVAVELPSLEAQVAGVLAASVTITTPADIVAAFDLAASVTIPPIGVSIDANAAAVADLRASMGSLQAQAAIGAAIAIQLGVPGVWLYYVEGNASDIIPGGIPGVSAPVAGVILLGTDAGAIAAINATFRTA